MVAEGKSHTYVSCAVLCCKNREGSRKSVFVQGYVRNNREATIYDRRLIQHSFARHFHYFVGLPILGVVGDLWAGAVGNSL